MKQYIFILIFLFLLVSSTNSYSMTSNTQKNNTTTKLNSFEKPIDIEKRMKSVEIFKSRGARLIVGTILIAAGIYFFKTEQFMAIVMLLFGAFFLFTALKDYADPMGYQPPSNNPPPNIPPPN